MRACQAEDEAGGKKKNLSRLTFERTPTSGKVNATPSLSSQKRVTELIC